MTVKPIDSVFANFLSQLEKLNLPPLYSLTPVQARARLNTLLPQVDPVPIAHVENLKATLGSHDVAVRVYRSESTNPLPALVFFHGGGWVLGGLDDCDNLCRVLAKQGHCVVVSVDYRLAPEHRFPAAIDDAYGVVKWVIANKEQINVDAERIAVGGESAGGNLAAVVALMSRDRSGPQLAFQLLICPVTNIADMESQSYRDFAPGYLLERETMAWYKNHYLGRGQSPVNSYVSPLLSENLMELPAAHIVTASHDILRDEGQAYAEALAEAGNAVSYMCYQGMIHGFINLFSISPQAKEALDEVATKLFQVLH